MQRKMVACGALADSRASRRPQGDMLLSWPRMISIWSVSAERRPVVGEVEKTIWADSEPVSLAAAGL
jgi:hypothetical protein